LLGVRADHPLAEGDLTCGAPSPTMRSLTPLHVRLDRSPLVNAKRLRFLARRHAAGHPPRSCAHDDPTTPCDAALLAAEVARIRAWADFASDLLDAHIWGFGPGDWQAAEALAIALYSSDWPPAWKRDPEDHARIIVDPSLWPTPGVNGPGGDAEPRSPG
jgi:hypothetical protein